MSLPKLIKDQERKCKEKLLLKEILEPPCKDCKYFNPTIKTAENGEYDGILLCRLPQNMNQWPDFSCFEPSKDIYE